MDKTLDEEVEFTPPNAFVPLDKNSDLNLSEVIHQFKLSLKMIGFCHIQAVQKRCLDLKDVLSGPAKELAEPHQPFGDLLFRPDLNKHFNKFVAVNKVCTKISKKTCGRRHFHPF